MQRGDMFAQTQRQQESLITTLTETLLGTSDQPLAIRPSKEIISNEVWKIVTSTGSCMQVPVVNLECVATKSCIRDLSEFIMDINNSKIKEESYTCSSCGNQRSLKNLRIDFLTLSIASRAKNAYFEWLALGKKPTTSQEIQELERKASQIGDTVQAKIRKNGVVEIQKDESVLKQYSYSMDCFDPSFDPKNNADFYQIPDFINASEKMISISSKASQNAAILEEVFESFSLSIDPDLEKAAYDAFEDAFSIDNEKYSALTNLTFVVPSEKRFEHYQDYLQLYYPAIRKSYPRVNLYHKNQGFKIPPASRLSSFIDPVSGKASILITGGFDTNEEITNKTYEIEFNMSKDMEIREGMVTETIGKYNKSIGMRKPRAYHSICWSHHMKKIIAFGGLTYSKEPIRTIEPTRTIELGAKEYVQGRWHWVWYHLKELKKPRLCASICTTERYLFVFGGFVKSNPMGYQKIDNSKDIIEIKEIERYDFMANRSSEICRISDSVHISHQAICFSNNTNGIIIFGGTNVGQKDNQKDRLVLFYDIETNNYREICKLDKIDTPHDSHYRYTPYLQNIELLVTSGPSQQLAVLKYDLSRDIISYNNAKE